LYHIYLRDQQARGLGLKRRDKNFTVSEQENLRQVEKVISEYGWPTFSMVGPVSVQGAFLVILHSDVRIQLKYFKHILKAAKKNEASKESIALMMDKINVQMEGVQIFGTQVYRRRDTTTGQWSEYQYYPIQDEEHVDSLRKEYGLIPLSDYYATFGIDYESPSK
jgi:hypothetical protein